MNNKNIVLVTMNARYSHSALGLYYLKANLQELQEQAHITEFTLETKIEDCVEEIFAYTPKIVGIGVYIWNVEKMLALAQMLKLLAPKLLIVGGGPELFYEVEKHPLFPYLDYVIPGEGERVFYSFCKNIFQGKLPGESKILPRDFPPLESLLSPYPLYSEENIKNRRVYVESSRGCPYHCEFCLSSRETKVRHFPLQHFLQDLSSLWNRGVREFKFIDRTFNLDLQHSLPILEFFLNQKQHDFFLHFEMVPHHLPLELKEVLKRFTQGQIQAEVGVQSFNPEVAKRVGRVAKGQEILENLSFLRNETQVYLHVDLIVGLPGESLESFAAGFDLLMGLSPKVHEIQIGILKCLPGALIARHTEDFEMLYNRAPPYDILQNQQITFTDLQRIKRLAKFWDLYNNSGNFKNTLPLLFKRKRESCLNQAFAFFSFLDFSDWCYQQVKHTSSLALERQALLLYRYLIEQIKYPASDVTPLLQKDYLCIEGRHLPPFLRGLQQEHSLLNKDKGEKIAKRSLSRKRQIKQGS
ncbi:MAG: DUF4080 domain-containing protein [Oligoflexia bacterium]|nr:DUF4080 domain-containing protein [Oligoflexia bacterium]